MATLIQVVDPDSAPLCVERIFVDASGDLRAQVSGVECSIGTQPALVEAGLVVFEPVDARQAQQRPVFSKLNVSGRAGQFWCVASDARLVNAAVRFNVLRRQTSVVHAQQLWPTAPQE